MTNDDRLLSLCAQSLAQLAVAAQPAEHIPFDVIDIANTGKQCSTPKHAACNSAWANLEIPFGIDYTLSRSFSLGVSGRYQLLLSHVSPVNAIGVFARVEYLWGY